MKRAFRPPSVIFALALAIAPSVWAHPHVTITASQVFVFDERGLKEIESAWRFDPFTSADFVSIYDKDKDGVLSPEEEETLAAEVTGNVASYNYFTHLFINGEKQPAAAVTRPAAAVEGDNVVLAFAIPCRLETGPEPVELRVSQYDSSYYTAFELASPAYRVEGVQGVDWSVEKGVRSEDAYWGGSVTPEELVLRFHPEGMVAQQEEQDRAAPPDAVNRPPDAGPVSARGESGTEDEASAHSARVHGATGARSLPVRLLAWLTAKQQALKAGLETYLTDRAGGTLSPSAVAMLCLFAFGYGLVHAAGPGHGKVIAATYMAGGPRGMSSAVLMGSLLAFFHGLSGIAVVVAGRFLLQKTAMSVMGSVDKPIKAVSFGLIALVGAVILATVFVQRRGREAIPVDERLSPEEPGNATGVLLALAAGCVPCPAVVLVMLFFSTTGHTILGVLLSVCTVLGMALTISGAGLLSIAGRNVAVGLAGGRKQSIHGIVRWLRAAGGAALFLFGLLCLWLVLRA